MRIMLVLFLVFFMNNFSNASEFELTIYFNLGVSEKHGIIKCRQGGKQLSTDYHLIVFNNKPKYTILGNLDLDEDFIGNVEGELHCDEGEFTLVKLISTTESFVNLFIYLAEIYFIKDKIFDIANVKLSSDADYFLQKKLINEAGVTVVKTAHIEEIISSESADPIVDNSNLLYRIEIRRK
jgi:hypothetical protein